MKVFTLSLANVAAQVYEAFKLPFRVKDRANFDEKFYDFLLGDPDFDISVAVHEFEAGLILAAARKTGGRVTKASKLLGLSHQNLSLILHQRHRDLKDAGHFGQRKARTVKPKTSDKPQPANTKKK